MLSLDKIYNRYIEAELIQRNTDDTTDIYKLPSLFNDVKFVVVQGRFCI